MVLIFIPCREKEQDLREQIEGILMGCVSGASLEATTIKATNLIQEDLFPISSTFRVMSKDMIDQLYDAYDFC